MRLLIIFIFFTSLFACDTSNRTTAYRDYNKAKTDYIQSILDNKKQLKIKSLRDIVKCGRYLGFNVSKYQNRLYELTKTHISKPKSKPKFQNPLKIQSNYISLISTNPIKIRLSKKMKIHFSTLYRSHTYYKIFDIYNAKVVKAIVKKLDKDKFLKIAQNNRKRVRVVIYSKKKFTIKYNITSSYLIIKIKYNKVKNQNKYIPLPAIQHNKVIVIDAGHGGKDPGGIGQYHIREKNIVLPLAKDLKYELTKRGYKVYLTRDSDKFITLRNRTKFANRKKADLFISLHCNIAPKHPEVHGIETYFLSPARSARAKRVARLENSAIGNLRTTTQNIVLNFLNKNKIIDSTKLALDIQKSLIYNLKKHYKGIKDGGVRPAPFWVLVGSSMPAILIETGFISNKSEARKLVNKTYQRRYAKYIADGIDNYFRKNP
jgi:N-acetylmuramoyl-L-alanine amidase